MVQRISIDWCSSRVRGEELSGIVLERKRNVKMEK